MALPWISVLRAVPWVDVLDKAPGIAEAATRLWNGVARQKSVVPEDDGIPTGPVDTPETRAMAALEERVARGESATGSLHEQLVSSLEMTAALAAQNVELIKSVDVLTRQARVLVWVTATIGVIAVAALIVALV